MSDRKYRQRGYQEDDRGREPQAKKQAQPKRDREGPRSPRMMAFGEKVKCAACAAVVPANVGHDSLARNATPTFTHAAHAFILIPARDLNAGNPLRRAS